MNDLSDSIKATRSEIDKLTIAINNASKAGNVDQGNIKKMRSRRADLSLELPKLIKQQWEETHERLDLSDDR